MAAPKSKPQDVTPGTFSHIKPGTNVVQVTPEDDEALGEYARQQGIPKSEAMRRMAEMIPPIPESPKKRSIANEAINMIQSARDLNLVDSDPKDPLNQVIKYGLFKDLKKDMKKGDEDRMSTREMMEMNMVNMQMLIMQKSMGGDNAQAAPNQQIQQMMQKYDQTISDLKAENEKTRAFYEQKQKEQEEKFKEIVLEKRIKDIEEGQERTLQTLSQQISEIENQIKAYQNIPPAPTEDQKKDAIAHLEQMGGTLDRIKKALTPFGIIPQSESGMTALSAPGSAISQYKNPDGSMNMTVYAVDKATEVAGRLLEAWSKKAPEPKIVQETQLMTGNGAGQGPPQKQMTYQEFYVYLLNKPSLTPEEQQWKASYEEYVTKVQRERAAPRPQQHAVQKKPDEIAYTDAVSQEQEQEQEQVSQPQQPQSEMIREEQQTPAPKKGIVERLQQLEAENNQYRV